MEPNIPLQEENNSQGEFFFTFFLINLINFKAMLLIGSLQI